VGRPPARGRAEAEGRARARHHCAHPVHVTLRALPNVPSLRGVRAARAVVAALAAASRLGLRVCHSSIQPDHWHLVVEAPDRVALPRGMRGLTIRVALAVNRALGRRGRLWADRYHARPLATRREVRHALVYVLQNWLKHDRRAKGLDPLSSARWLDGWRGARTKPTGSPPVAAAGTWLLRTGWRRHGLLDWNEAPRSG
jgi:REP element-mobilizing transposase RayT